MKNKKIKSLIKKAKRLHKAVTKFLLTTYKNYIKMKQEIKKALLLVVFTIAVCSCGTTKVTVNKPDNGTYTQITVTTNNPITTSNDAKAQLNGKEE